MLLWATNTIMTAQYALRPILEIHIFYARPILIIIQSTRASDHYRDISISIDIEYVVNAHSSEQQIYADMKYFPKVFNMKTKGICKKLHLKYTIDCLYPPVDTTTIFVKYLKSLRNN